MKEGWLIATAALASGALGFLWGTRAQAGERAGIRFPTWLVLLGGVVVLAFVLFEVVEAVCGDQTGLSCGG